MSEKVKVNKVINQGKIIAPKDLEVINEILNRENDVRIELRGNGPVIIEMKAISLHKLSTNF